MYKKETCILTSQEGNYYQLLELGLDPQTVLSMSVLI